MPFEVSVGISFLQFSCVSHYNGKPSFAEVKMKNPLSNYHICFPLALKTMQIPKFSWMCFQRIIWQLFFFFSFVKYWEKVFNTKCLFPWILFCSLCYYYESATPSKHIRVLSWKFFVLVQIWKNEVTFHL